jgi:hypothetical protein
MGEGRATSICYQNHFIFKYLMGAATHERQTNSGQPAQRQDEHGAYINQREAEVGAERS